MKENFDDIIRRRWEEQQFPVDDAHRQAMEKLLEGDKKKRGFIFWWIGGLAVTMLIGFSIWMFNTPESQAIEKTNLKAEAKGKDEFASAKPIAPVQRVEEEANKAEVAELAKAKVEEYRNSKAEAERTNQIEISQSSTSNKQKNPGKAVKQDKLNDQAGIELNPRTEYTQNTEQILSNNESPIEPMQGVKGELPGSQPPAEGYQVELDNPNQASILSNEASIKVFPDSIEYDPGTNAIYRDGTIRSLNITKPIDALSINEVEQSVKNGPGNITPHTRITHPVYFLAETGLGMVLASKPYYDGGIKFNIGGGLGMKLIPRVHMQLTGGYLMQDGGFDFERTSTVNSLSFGVRSQFNSLAPDRLHFVYAKLGAAYRFQRSTLDVHMGVQWLYGAQGLITIQSQSQVPPGNQEESKYTWLSTDGLRKTQWWSDVSYGYMILPKLYLHGGFTFYYSSLTETNTSLQQEGYYWNGKTATVQPFITLNYLLHANF